MLDVNTVSKHPTHFLRAVELITEARSEFNVPSENWPWPTYYRFGIPNDRYYAEVWTDGMDWQPSFWVIEELNINNPLIQPLIIFEHNEQCSQFNDVDFAEFIHAMLYYRRDYTWAHYRDLGDHHCELGYFTDTIWPFLSLVDDEVKYQKMKLYAFKHASQIRVLFWLNESFVPEVYRGKKREKNSNRGDSNPRYLCSI